jgi:putative phosphoribosyl transferase
VAYAVALALRAPLDVFLVRKLGVPGREELAMGAIASGGIRVLNRDVLLQYDISPATVDWVANREWPELERRERAYRDGRPPAEVAGQIVLLVDDGLATGSTMRAAAMAVRGQDPAHIVVAVPVAAGSTCADLRPEVDEIVCAALPEPFYAVGLWYADFSAVEDQEVHDLIARAASRDLSDPPATACMEPTHHPSL